MFYPSQRLYQEFSFDVTKNKVIGIYDTGINFQKNSIARLVTVRVVNNSEAVTVNAGCTMTIGFATVTTAFSADLVPMFAAAPFSLFGGRGVVGEAFLLKNSYTTGSGGRLNISNVFVEIAVADAISGVFIAGFEYFVF